MANSEHVAIVRKGVLEWNEWRKHHPHIQPDLSGADLSNFELTNANFTGADIRGTNFFSANLKEAIFINAIAGLMRYASLYQLSISIVNGLIVGILSIMPGVTIYYLLEVLYKLTVGNKVTIQQCLITILIFSSTFILFIISSKDNKFRVINLIGGTLAIFLGFIVAFANSKIVVMIGIITFLFIFICAVKLRQTGLVNLASISFVGLMFIASAGIVTNLIGSVEVAITGAFTGVLFLTILIYESVRAYVECNEKNLFRKVNIYLDSIKGTNFQSADLRNADFTGAFLKNTLFDNTCNLIRTKWEGVKGIETANLICTVLENRTVRELLVSLNGQNKSYLGLNLNGAYLVKAKLNNADFRNADLREADLTGANITGVKLYGVAREGCKFENVECLYVFLDQGGTQRYPIEKDFLPGEFEELYKNLNEINEQLIKRFIEFPPEYKQAGISILNYFGEIIRKKYPDSKATVQIKQDGLKVSMIVDPVDGERRIFEKELNRFGLVVTGKMSPEEYANNDRLLLLELKNELRVAYNRIETQKELLEFQKEEIHKQEQHLKAHDIQIEKLLSIIGNGLFSDNRQKNNKTLSNMKAFISYAEDDILTAKKIYSDINNSGIKSWLSEIDLNPGENKNIAMKRALSQSDFFIPLLSKSSISKKGTFQKELRYAFSILDECPEEDIFIIPVKIEDCNPIDERLNALHFINLHQIGYSSGIETILNVMKKKK